MRAIRQHEFGGPEVLQVEDVPDLDPGAGEVRIAVATAGVHVVDTTIRRGVDGGPFPRPELPMTPGREVAGTVDQVGRGVDPSWIGRRVVAHLGEASGGYAEQVVTAVSALLPLSDRVDPVDAVAMVGTGRTTMAILEVANLTAEDVVLVTAAAGGIGALLVQAASHVGATVVAVAGGPAKVDVVAGLGAAVAVDYDVDGWAAQVAAGLGERRVTIALDGVGGERGRQAFELVAPGGRFVMFGYSAGAPIPLSAGDLFRTGVTVSAAIGPRLTSRGPDGLRWYAARALDELEAGRLHPLVNPPFPLADAAAAHRALETRQTMGKVVLVP